MPCSMALKKQSYIPDSSKDFCLFGLYLTLIYTLFPPKTETQDWLLLVFKVILILVTFFTFFPFEYANYHAVSYGYMDQFSVKAGTAPLFYLNSVDSSRSNKFEITSITGARKHTFFAPSYVQSQVLDSAWSNGFNFKKAIRCNESLISDIYMLNDQIPFVVKSNDIKPLTLVYPLASYNLSNRMGGRSYYKKWSANNVSSSMLSFHRPQQLYPYTKDLCEFLYKNQLEYDVVTDLDLDTYESIKGKHTLVVFGSSITWTKRSAENLRKFIVEGGNVLLMTSTFMECEIEIKDQSMIVKADEDKRIKSVTYMGAVRNYNNNSIEGVKYNPSSFLDVPNDTAQFPFTFDLGLMIVTDSLNGSISLNIAITPFDTLIVHVETSKVPENSRMLPCIFEGRINNGKVLSLSSYKWMLPEYLNDPFLSGILLKSINFLDN